jgi:hypothetical protein
VKKVKKTFLVDVIIKQHNKGEVPDFGLGKGVLMRQEITFCDDNGRGFDSPLFFAAMKNAEDKILEDTFEVKWTEKKKKQR